ncbi:PH domain-containing protein [Chungangia koreensis]|uniref:PH domain-containing protein n=1 Tax=Chungangia koreensis TaxID=752657 RepID=A0ABV8X166_9LACT
MIFRSKVDRIFVITIGMAILILAASCFFPYFLEDEVPLLAGVILTSTFLLCTGFIVWISIDIRYKLNDDHLFIKAGPIRRRIPYNEITRVSPNRDIFTGFRILSSSDGLEVSYKSAIMGGVKISPENKELFVTELKKRCPNIKS